MPRLRILAGPSTTDLKPIRANSGDGADVSSEVFEGKVAVFIKGFADPDGKVSQSEYFEHEERRGVTWSIQVQGMDIDVLLNGFEWGLTVGERGCSC